ncbi:MAG: aldolase/citrate lyase family protein [Thermotogota bacterium]|nr:aldolase/citrate lyase family protein [Thermotogota bacterium]
MPNDEKVEIGSWLTRPDLAITEVMSKSGFFNWLTIDIEHTTISLNQMEEMVRIIQLSGVDAFVRLSKNDCNLIKRVLDSGSDGIIVPMVNSGEDVQKAIDACFYPPNGNRGVGLARAQYYSPKGFHEYKKVSEPKTKVIIQIEHIDAVKHIDEIFSVEDIYGYFVGPYDLSASLGKAGNFKCRELTEALEIIKEAGIRYGVKSGYHVIEPDPEELQVKKDEGYRIIGVSLDMLFLLCGMNSFFNPSGKTDIWSD